MLYFLFFASVFVVTRGAIARLLQWVLGNPPPLFFPFTPYLLARVDFAFFGCVLPFLATLPLLLGLARAFQARLLPLLRGGPTRHLLLVLCEGGLLFGACSVLLFHPYALLLLRIGFYWSFSLVQLARTWRREF